MPRDVMPLTDDERIRMVQNARAFINVRFKHQGRSRDGMDCVGLGKLSLKGIRSVTDVKGYGRWPTGELRQALMYAFGDPVAKAPVCEADVCYGDFLLMAFPSTPTHIGIVGDYEQGGLSLIHASLQFRKVVEHNLSAAWLAKVLEVYRP